DDGDNPKTLKNYLIVLRHPRKPECPGSGPVIAHSPSDVSTLSSVRIAAEVSDDVGLKHEPLLYYSLEPLSAPPELTSMTQVSMGLVAGTMQAGTWVASVPNPVVAGSQGESADIHYVIVANDDDTAGDCDHVVQAPGSGVFRMTVTNPGGTGGQGLCEPCTADVQCGSGNLCVRLGGTADAACSASGT